MAVFLNSSKDCIKDINVNFVKFYLDINWIYFDFKWICIACESAVHVYCQSQVCIQTLYISMYITIYTSAYETKYVDKWSNEKWE